jgi:hypothetical protein
VRNCLTDVNQPFSIHSIQSLLWWLDFHTLLHEAVTIF